jgi:hypothetical protein
MLAVRHANFLILTNMSKNLTRICDAKRRGVMKAFYLICLLILTRLWLEGGERQVCET